ncbi:MAG TPA: ABC transporter substrate-binding protein [Anaerolineae bacterium]
MSSNNHSQNTTRTGWTILVGIVVVTLLLNGCVSASTPKVYRVGILSGLDFFADAIDGFKAKMTELGYVEGQNIVYDVQKANFDMALYRSTLQRFVADKVDLIFVFPTEASLEAKAATQGTNIPIVFALAFIEGVDLVDSLREPGGNITGVRYPGPDIALRRFEVLRELAPQAKRIWIAYQRGYPTVPSQLEVLRPVAEAAGVTLIEVPADNGAELQADLDARAAPGDIGLDAILSLAEPLAVAPDAFAVMVKFAYEHKLPIGGSLASAGDYGNVFGVDVNDVAAGEQAALLADKIFKGIPAGTIPVVSADNYLRINYKVAQELGLTVPEGLLSQAQEIIR